MSTAGGGGDSEGLVISSQGEHDLGEGVAEVAEDVPSHLLGQILYYQHYGLNCFHLNIYKKYTFKWIIK